MDLSEIVPSAILDNFVIAFLAVSVASGAVVPSGDTRLAITLSASRPTGAVVIPSSPIVFTVPSAFTLSAGYHLPSVARTKRLPSLSVYTTVPASPLRNAFTFDVKSLPFKPSEPVGPCAPMPASVPVPGLPSRPSTAVSPSLAALSITLRVASSKPMFTMPFSSVVILIPVFVTTLSVLAVVLVAPAAKPVGAIVPVPALKVKPVVTATDFAASDSTL